MLAPLGQTLTSLNVAGNQLHTLSGLGHLPRLTALDVSHNKLSDAHSLLSALAQAPALSLDGNSGKTYGWSPTASKYPLPPSL